ncbi:MAG: PfkB family carbohydrate kinase [Oscillospiraceae bacterium]|jgi:2-dehydro-3-deoxygluconokinase|nr:PfkB family carbohydrate kinase [Oscillospiraceae bacterium]
MKLKLRENCKYGIATPTSMGVRISPLGGAPVHTSNTYFMHATSAESNAINISSSLGIKGLVLTNFVQDSPISYLIKSELRRRNIDYIGPDIPQGGPWGYRHQFNIADSGFGTRGPRVHNDRAGEVGLTLNAKDFDFEKIFGEDGVQILHLSGLVGALSPDTTKFCKEAIKAAKKHGTLVSFDMNHRASFWKGREAELRADFTEMVNMTDILIGNEEDYQLALGIEGPKEGGEDILTKVDDFKEMVGRLKKAFPNASVFGNTLRQVISVGEHMWGVLSLFGDTWTVIEPRPIQILDRIGGGDGFSGGLLYGILTAMEPEKATQFAWATGALATTVMEDYATPIDEEMVWSIFEGNARVKR